MKKKLIILFVLCPAVSLLLISALAAQSQVSLGTLSAKIPHGSTIGEASDDSSSVFQYYSSAPGKLPVFHHDGAASGAQTGIFTTPSVLSGKMAATPNSHGGTLS